MTYDILIFVYRKPGISHADFKRHYETKHIPLLQQYGGKHFPKTHRRHYLSFDENNQLTLLQGDKDGIGFDVVAQVSFQDQAAFDAFIEALTPDDISKVLVEDEERFSDREKMKVVVVGETKETKRQA